MTPEDIETLLRNYFSITSIVEELTFSYAGRTSPGGTRDTGRFMRHASSYEAEECLRSLGPSVMEPLILSLSSGRHIAMPLFVREIRDHHMGFVTPEHMASNTLNDILVAYEEEATRIIKRVLMNSYHTLIESAKALSGQSDRIPERIFRNILSKKSDEFLLKGIENILRSKAKSSDIWRDMLRQRSKENFRGVVKVVCYICARQERAALTDLMIELYSEERSPDSYSRQFDRLEPDTPVKIIFEALVFIGKNGNPNVEQFLRDEARSFSTGSHCLRFLHDNGIVEPRDLSYKIVDWFSPRVYDDIDGALRQGAYVGLWEPSGRGTWR